MFVIVLFLIVAFFAIIPLIDSKYKLCAFIFINVILVCFAAFRGEDFTDYKNYIMYFERNGDIFVEPAFILISAVIHLFSYNVIFLFVIFAILGVSLKFLAIKELTQLWLLSIVIYISYFYILHELVQIRAGVATGFLLLCIKPIYDRNFKRFMFLAFLAITFHYSAILIIPLYFLNKNPSKKWLLFSVPLAYLIYFLGVNLIVFLPVTGIQEKIELYKQLNEELQEETINVFNLLFLARVAIFYFIIWKYELINSHNKYTPVLLKIYGISLMSLLLFAQMPVVAFRLNEFFGIVEIILVPLIYYTILPSTFSKTIVILIGANFLFILIFYNKIIPF
jgi:hypothetical protein